MEDICKNWGHDFIRRDDRPGVICTNCDQKEDFDPSDFIVGEEDEPETR